MNERTVENKRDQWMDVILMPGLSTRELVDLALTEANMHSLPDDSVVFINGESINKVLFGIDIGNAELLLARDLECDGVIAHHPPGGSSILNFPKVLFRHVELLVEHGVPVEAAKEAVDPIMSRSILRAQSANFDHVPSVARLLGIPFLNLHLPLDEIGRRMMVDAIESHIKTLNGSPTVGDAIKALYSLPEFAEAPTRIMLPVGEMDAPLDKYAVVHGAGTNGGFSVAKCYFDHGVNTVIYIHVAHDQAERLERETRGNLIVTGHIAADLIGINAFVQKLEEAGVEVIRISGL
jgi:putative NIF3 family GTP cyclohydrolase 1 type 2